MEHFSITLWLLFVSFITLLFALFHKHRSNYTVANLPPGHPGFPIVGETLDFLSNGWKGHQEKFIFDRVAKYSSQIFKTNLLCEPMAVFCDVAGNKFLFSNENKLVTVWWPRSFYKIFPSTTQASSKEVQVKKLRDFISVTQMLKPEALQRYIGIMDTTANEHFASKWENKSHVLVFPLAKQYTFRLACRLFLSIEDPHQVSKLEESFHLISTGLNSLPINLPGTPFKRSIKTANLVREKLFNIIKQRKVDLSEGKASPTQDALSHMLTSDESGQFMNEIDIADKIIGLLIGSHGTVSAVCTFIVNYLAEIPHIYELVYKEQIEIAKSKVPGETLNWNDIQKMKYSWNVACEVMRLVPPQQGGFREAMNDFIFNGFSIPKGWKLYWNANATHRNPEYFPEPLKFDPTRFEGKGPAPYTFVPFGGGPRMCPGKDYARVTILVFLHNIVKRYKWEKMLHDEKVIVDFIPIPTKGLPVLLYPYKS